MNLEKKEGVRMFVQVDCQVDCPWCVIGVWHIGLNCFLKMLSAQQCLRKWMT